jgi:hypothetical protein
MEFQEESQALKRKKEDPSEYLDALGKSEQKRKGLDIEI